MHKVPAANGHQPAPGREREGMDAGIGAKATVLDCMEDAWTAIRA